MDFRKNKYMRQLNAEYIKTFAMFLNTGDFIPETVLESMLLLVYKNYKKDTKKPKQEYKKVLREEKRLKRAENRKKRLEKRKILFAKIKMFFATMFKRKKKKALIKQKQSSEGCKRE